MPNVYLVNEPRKNSFGTTFDVSAANLFGTIITVFDAKQFPRPSRSTELAVEHARTVLDEITEDDYILYAGGDVIGLAIVAQIADNLLDGRLKFLRWDKDLDAETGRYTKVEVNND